MARDLIVRLAQDRPGELAGVVRALSQAGINIEGIAEVDGAVHLLAHSVSAARGALRNAGYAIEDEREVVVIPMPDRPGELAMTISRLAEAGVNVKFVYLATQTRVVIGADDVMKARAAVEGNQPN